MYPLPACLPGIPLFSDLLFVAAQRVARSDEEERRPGTRLLPPHQPSERTLHSWSGAKLVNLQRSLHVTWSRSQREAFRRIYADEYRRARAIRSAAWSTATASRLAKQRAWHR